MLADGQRTLGRGSMVDGVGVGWGRGQERSDPSPQAQGSEAREGRGNRGCRDTGMLNLEYS